MGILFTKTCILCGKTIESESNAILCPPCAQSVRTNYRCSEPFTIDGTDGAASPLLYKGSVANAMKRFKFQNRPQYADWFAAQTCPLLAERMESWNPQLITFIPIGLLRRHQRGYNQAELLARNIARTFSLPCTATLKKQLFTPKQSARKDAAARKENALHAFTAKSGIDLGGKSVILVDDIITTGATISAAAEILREMGAIRVYALAPVRTPLREK